MYLGETMRMRNSIGKGTLGLLAFIAISTGCADISLNSELDDSSIGPNDTDFNNDTGDGEPYGSTVPLHWSISGNLTLFEGEIAPESSPLSVHFWGESELICSRPLTITEVHSSDTALPDPELYSWWNIHVEHGESSSEKACEWLIPASSVDVGEARTLQLGTGPFDSRLEGAMAYNGIASENSSLHSLYISDRSDAERLLLFGIIGTDQQYNEPDQYNEENPLVDGQYSLMSLYLLVYFQ